MGLQLAETAEEQAQREDLIETSYIGDYERFKGTTGEAYYNVHSNSWHYRPYSEKGKLNRFFIEVKGEDLDCIDSGWVNGVYTGAQKFNTEGKARWSEERDKWEYKPKGYPRTVFISEGEFTITRDEDY